MTTAAVIIRGGEDQLGMSWTQMEYPPPKAYSSNATMTVPGGNNSGSRGGSEGVVVGGTTTTTTNPFKEYVTLKPYDGTNSTTTTTTSIPFNTPSQWASDGKSLAAHIARAMPTPPESPPPAHLATTTTSCESHVCLCNIYILNIHY